MEYTMSEFRRITIIQIKWVMFRTEFQFVTFTHVRSQKLPSVILAKHMCARVPN